MEQKSKGIRQCTINLYTFPMMMHKSTPSLDYNYWLKRLDIKLNETTNQNSMKVPKVVKLMNDKSLI